MSLINESNRKWWILAAMGASLSMVVMDETVIGVALPTIRHDLSMGAVGSHWVVNAYILLFTCFAATAGKLEDIFHLGKVVIAGSTIFGIASIGCALAQNGLMLILSRGLQGVSGAVLFTVSVAVITAVFPPKERGLAFGIQTAVGGTFIALGPMIGGFFTEILSWRWVFLANLLVIGFVYTIILTSWKPTNQRPTFKYFDWSGFLLLIGGLGSFMSGLMQGPQWGWSNPAVISLLVIGFIWLVIFARIETRKKSPLIDLRLMAIPEFTGPTLLLFHAETLKLSMLIFTAQYMQVVLGMNALAAGFAMLPAVVSMPFTSYIAGKASDRFGPGWLTLIGMIIMASAALATGFLMPFKRYELLVVPLFLWGSSMPAIYVPGRNALMNAAPSNLAGQAAGVQLTFQFLGGALATAVCGALVVITGDYRSALIAPPLLSIFFVWLAWRTIPRTA
ncbi:MAG: MFS transporter [Cyanobacteria bacterium P01_H01_bin.15]